MKEKQNGLNQSTMHLFILLEKNNIFCSNYKLLYLALNLFLDEVILALVIEDDVDFLCAVATDIRAWVKQITIVIKCMFQIPLL